MICFVMKIFEAVGKSGDSASGEPPKTPTAEPKPQWWHPKGYNSPEDEKAVKALASVHMTKHGRLWHLHVFAVHFLAWSQTVCIFFTTAFHTPVSRYLREPLPPASREAKQKAPSDLGKHGDSSQRLGPGDQLYSKEELNKARVTLNVYRQNLFQSLEQWQSKMPLAICLATARVYSTLFFPPISSLSYCRFSPLVSIT
jgi:hypothetical protein